MLDSAQLVQFVLCKPIWIRTIIFSWSSLTYCFFCEMQDMDGGNWWLGIGQSFIGYWPAKLFTHLADGPAKLVQWGGEIVNTRNYGQHTTTQMGSGHFAEEGFGKASFFRNLRIINYLYHLQPVQEFFLQTLNTTCYNAQKGFNEEWGAHFYYGGPGYNALCPQIFGHKDIQLLVCTDHI